MADRAPSDVPRSAAGVDAPQLTRLNMFGTPLMIATLPEARPYCGTRERISIAINFGLANVWS